MRSVLLAYYNNLRILRVNNTHTICYSLVDRKLKNVNKGFKNEIMKLDTGSSNIDLKANFDDALRQLIECEYNILHLFVKNKCTDVVSVNRLIMHTL